ncbi:MAG TPA: AbrB family transcriptional regulator [Acidilobales archaeon]|nr:MAG: AbrB family transcriptional regulator [Thermoprotei archaeon]HDD26591.1 AbrB family transcriptional regulator [Acidilobales archaeon]
MKLEWFIRCGSYGIYGRYGLSIVVIDERGRIVIPSKLRRKLKLKKGDMFIILEFKDDLLVLKKVDVERIVKDIAEEVIKAGLDLEELGRKVEEEANRLAKKIHD